MIMTKYYDILWLLHIRDDLSIACLQENSSSKHLRLLSIERELRPPHLVRHVWCGSLSGIAKPANPRYSESGKVVSSFVGNIGQQDSKITDIIQHFNMFPESDGKTVWKASVIPNRWSTQRHWKRASVSAESLLHHHHPVPGLGFCTAKHRRDEARWFVSPCLEDAHPCGDTQHKPNTCKLQTSEVALRWIVKNPSKCSNPPIWNIETNRLR